MSQTVDQEQRLRQKLPAGIVDAALSSLGTFAAGLAAVRWLEPAELGTYSVIFSAFLVASLLPNEIIYTPVQVSMIRLAVQERLGGIVHSLGRGIPPAMLGCTLILAAGGLIWWRSDPTAVIELAITGVGLAVISPMQDHLRRGFHIAERSWGAALMSGSQLVAVVAALLVMQSMGLAPAWAPLGSLVVANIVSLGFGLVMSRGAWRVRPTSPAVMVSGRWLAASSISAYGGTLVASVVMTLVAGPEIVGFAEAARVAAQPVLVVTTGVAAALASRHLRAAASVDRAAAITINKSFFLVITVAGISYLCLAGFAWSFNPAVCADPNRLRHCLADPRDHSLQPGSQLHVPAPGSIDRLQQRSADGESRFRLSGDPDRRSGHGRLDRCLCPTIGNHRAERLSNHPLSIDLENSVRGGLRIV